MYDYAKESRRVVFMIDSKSFYASCESVELGLNPLRSILVVMSTAENTNGGLVLAASPMAKKLFGISNVMRTRDVPKDDRIIVVPPRMNLYIKYNLAIHEIFKSFAAEEDIQPYSIDESLIDMTDSWKLFGDSPREVARKIQLKVKEELGIYLTVGIGDNPLLAKFALDMEAKRTHSLIGEWHYEDVQDKLWPVTQLDDLWSIGHKTSEKLNKLGINSMYDLAHYNPFLLKQKFGVIGSQLFAFSWGIDRAIVRNKYQPKAKSYGNSQVLPRDYTKQEEIETVLREIAEQVATRIRSHQKAATVISLGIGYSFRAKEETGKRGFGHFMKIDGTNDNGLLAAYAITLFRDKWQGGAVRNISISCAGLVDDNVVQLNLFDTKYKTLKNRNLDRTVDDIRKKYGFTSLIKLSSKSTGATAVQRAGLVGGHAGGNSYE
ncbi:Y-family DNA polymerase (plasmid) [Latilactobacillus sakei]